MNAEPPAESLPRSGGQPGVPEAVRLVIWDLDETFWHGTLTEGGIKWNEHAAETVRELARRGIISAICSKNDPAPVQAVLAEHDFTDYFVFPSISWEPKGPRLATLIEQIQLRAPTVLFIDDNPMNRAEAEHFAPGIQVANETIITTLLADPRLRGKPDPGLTRLAQYKLLERRATEQAQSGTDTAAFLRASEITVSIEHDIDAHIDRAIELINRTNQLNFTKQRLPEDPIRARAALRTLLQEHNIQAGLLRVRDRYGDYGFVGIYIMLSQRRVGRQLHYFAFSCRILGMGIETWLYRRLERPKLNVVGDVLTNVHDEEAETPDWITVAPIDAQAAAPAAHRLKYVLARGACDMRALAHYFSLVTDHVVEEFDQVRNGQLPLCNHSAIAAQAIESFPREAAIDFAPFGYRPKDFKPFMAGHLPPGPAVWLLSFSIEVGIPLFRHRLTGAMMPVQFVGLKTSPELVLKADPSETGIDPELVAHLRENFIYAGPPTDADVRANLRTILRAAPGDVRVFILLGNEHIRTAAGRLAVAQNIHHRNKLVSQVAAEFGHVTLIAPTDIMSGTELALLKRPHHYDRMVYHRIFEYILERLN